MGLRPRSIRIVLVLLVFLLAASLHAVSEENDDVDTDAADEGRQGAIDDTVSDLPVSQTQADDSSGVPDDDTLGGDESTGDDRSIRVDDDAYRRIDSERDALQERLSSIEVLRHRMESKADLLKRVQSLREHKAQSSEADAEVRSAEQRAEGDYKTAVLRKNATWDEKESIAKERRRVEGLLDQLRKEKGSSEIALRKVEGERKRISAREKELQSERDRLLQQVSKLADQFRQRGLHTWLEHHVKSLNPILKETILKASDALDPVVRGVEEATELNEILSTEASEAITKLVPAIKNSPFYTGLIFYVLLLFPTVAAAWLVMKIRARLSMLTVEHYVIAINLYFGIMACVCTFMSLVGRSDILVVFHHRSRQLCESFMVFHGLLFILHLVLHGLTAYVSGSRKDFAQYVCMSCVGFHFFMNAYRRTILGHDPHVGVAAYVAYATVFLLTLYDRGIRVIEAAVSGRKTTVNSLGTFPTETPGKGQEPGASVSNGGSSDPTVYFAGLPVFNGPSESALTDAKTI